MGWARLGLIGDPGKVKPSQGGRRGRGVDDGTCPRDWTASTGPAPAEANLQDTLWFFPH